MKLWWVPVAWAAATFLFLRWFHVAVYTDPTPGERYQRAVDAAIDTDDFAEGP